MAPESGCAPSATPDAGGNRHVCEAGIRNDLVYFVNLDKALAARPPAGDWCGRRSHRRVLALKIKERAFLLPLHGALPFNCFAGGVYFFGVASRRLHGLVMRKLLNHSHDNPT